MAAALLLLACLCHASASSSLPRRLPVSSPLTLDWGGHGWFLKAGIHLPGPGAGSLYDPAAIWVDAAGDLHLKIAPSDPAACSGWASAELWTQAAFGYGVRAPKPRLPRAPHDWLTPAPPLPPPPTPSTAQTYTVAFQAPLYLDPFVTFGAFLWDDDSHSGAAAEDPRSGGGLAGHRELDFELGTWGNPVDPTAYQFVVQPWQDAANLIRLPLAGQLGNVQGGELGPQGGSTGCGDLGPSAQGGAQYAELTLVLDWSPGVAHFRLLQGTGLGGPVAGEWSMADAVKIPTAGGGPQPFGAHLHLNLWLNDPSLSPQRGRPVHVVVHSFAFTPLGAARALALALPTPTPQPANGSAGGAPGSSIPPAGSRYTPLRLTLLALLSAVTLACLALAVASACLRLRRPVDLPGGKAKFWEAEPVPASQLHYGAAPQAAEYGRGAVPQAAEDFPSSA